VVVSELKLARPETTTFRRDTMFAQLVDIEVNGYLKEHTSYTIETKQVTPEEAREMLLWYICEDDRQGLADLLETLRETGVVGLYGETGSCSVRITAHSWLTLAKDLKDLPQVKLELPGLHDIKKDDINPNAIEMN
jgi:hypothetical protein